MSTIFLKQANPDIVVLPSPGPEATSLALRVNFPDIVAPVFVELELFGA